MPRRTGADCEGPGRKRGGDASACSFSAPGRAAATACWAALAVLTTDACPGAERLSGDSLTVRLDVRAPWRARESLGGLRPDPADPGVMLAAFETDGAGSIALRLADIPGLALRWPVGLAEPFVAAVRIEPPPDTGTHGRIVAYVKDPCWRICEFPGEPEPGAGGEPASRVTVPVRAALDLTEIGIAIRGGAKGSIVRIRFPSLVLRASARHEPVRPPEGPRVCTLGADRPWRPDTAYLGVTDVTHRGGKAVLTCRLDPKDRLRRNGVVWVDVTDAGRPLDASELGAFVTLCGPPEYVCGDEVECGVGVGMRDADGGLFWGRGRPTLEPEEPTTVGFYPEMRFPPSLAFCSERFDARRVVAVGVRVRMDGRKARPFAGELVVEDLRLVRIPPEYRARRDRIAERIGRANWLCSLSAGPRTGGGPVPIEQFLENVGVNYPWPRGVYAPVGARPWAPGEGGFSACADRLAADLEYLVAHRVRMVRLFIFCDGRTGIVEDEHGRLGLDAFALRDIRALLDTAGRYPSLRLIPTLFDFHLANEVERENLAVVGEHPDWIADPSRRDELLEAIQPAIDLLAGHPQVAYIDLINEPEHAAGVGPDDMRAFVAAVADRVHRTPGARCTVGSASANYAAFWLSCGIDFATCHWFDRIELSHPLGQHAAALDPSRTHMTEVDPGVGVGRALTRLWEAGYGGACFWSLNSEDDYAFRGQPAEEFRQWVAARQGAHDREKATGR